MALDVPDIYCVGTGMVGSQQLTREAWTALEQAETVFVQNPEKALLAYLAEELDATVHDVNEAYEEGRKRSEIYDDIATALLDEAGRASDPVVLAAYGHPTVGVSVTALVRERAPGAGLDVEVLPGVSSLDCLFVELDIDPLHGLQLYEATDLLVYEYDLDVHVPLVLFQVGVVETYRNTSQESVPSRFERLQAFLTDAYAFDHEAVLARVATHPLADADIRRFRLDELAGVADTISTLHSLYVPPLSERQPANETLYEQATSTDHLEEITRE